MAIPNNTSITLGETQAKKDAVVTQLAPVVAGSQIALWAASGVDETKPQSVVGDFHKLLRWAQANSPAIVASIADPRVIHMPSGGGDADIELDGIPTADEVRLYIGGAIATDERSHALDRTFKRIVERWLEESK